MSDGDHDFGPRGNSGFTRKGNLATAADAVAAFSRSIRPRVDADLRDTYGARLRRKASLCNNNHTRPQQHQMTALVFTPEQAAASKNSKAWPFEEARRLIKRLERLPDGDTKTVLFETGYGPSGLPHIGTFGEVARTTMVRNAFRPLTEGKRKTRLLCFSDDMDGMRKIPENVPDRACLEPLSAHAADRGAQSVRRRLSRASAITTTPCCAASSTPSASTTNSPAPREYYKSGRFDDALLRAAEKLRRDHGGHAADARAPSGRRPTRPFLPISPKTGRVLYVPMKHVDAKAGTITFDDEDGTETHAAGHRRPGEAAVEAGFRHALGGARRRFRDVRQGPPDQRADLRPHLRTSSAARRPSIMSTSCSSTTIGQKISKSKGNGLTIDEWLTYASPESLALYMFQKPRRPSGSISTSSRAPSTNIFHSCRAISSRTAKERLDNPVWHIHDGNPPAIDMPVHVRACCSTSFGSNAQDKDVLWGFISPLRARRDAGRHIPNSTGSPATRSATSTTS